MTLNEKLEKFYKKLIKLRLDHERLMKVLPEDRHYHEGKKDMAEGLSVEFKLQFNDEIKQSYDSNT